MNGRQLGRQVGRAVVAARAMDEMQRAMVRAAVALVLVDLMASSPLADALGGDPEALAALKAGGFPTGGLVRPGNYRVGE